jgi:hypothetical protein
MGSFLSNWTVPPFLRARTLVPPIHRGYTTCPQVGAAVERRRVGRPKVRKTHACPEEEVVVVTTRRIDGAKPGPGRMGAVVASSTESRWQRPWAVGAVVVATAATIRSL